MTYQSRIADEIETRLRAAGTPARAEQEKRYLKSSLEHLGATVAQVRREAKGAAKEQQTHEELLSLVRALWQKPIHERRAAAVFLLDARARLLGPEDVVLIEGLVHEAKTWALVDVLAGDVLGALIVAHPDTAETVDSWVVDPDFWLRRAALLSQLAPLKAGVPFERFAGYAEAMLDEREFFIRKAIGWVLRETGKRRPDEVFEWLLPRAHRASGVTTREAVKYLPDDQRTAVLAARETRHLDR